jgi:transcriptional regulator with XRE-family HTH domain
MTAQNLVKHLRETAHLSHKELAEKCGVSTQVVLRTEQFLYPKLSDKIANQLPGLSGYDIQPGSLKAIYLRQRRHHVREFSKWITDAVDYRTVVSRSLAHAEAHHNSRKSPIECFRVFLFEHYGLPASQIKFCASTGLHPYLLSQVEKGRISWEQSKQLREVLSDVFDLMPSQIRILGALQDAYYLTVGE